MNGLLFFSNYPQIHLSNNPATRFLSGWVGQKTPAGECCLVRFPAGKFFMNCEVPIETGVLVIGYGNTLRGDDGVGPRVAEAVGCLRLPGVRTLICPLLTPELADQISRAEKVIFVDAAVDAPNAVQWRRLEPNETSQLMAHAADPRTMLAIARDVFGHVPAAWWLTIPAVDLGFREEFSPEVQRGFDEAVKKIRAFCR
jgi:hydrogenase maturation protease